MKKILVFAVCDYVSLPNGGEVMLLNNFLSANCCENLQYYLVGMSFCRENLVGKWTQKKIGNRLYPFFPVTQVIADKEKTHIPFRLRVACGIKKFWREINQAGADFHYIHSAELAIPMWGKKDINLIYHMHGDPCQTLRISRFPIFRIGIFSALYWKVIERTVMESRKIIWAANRSKKLYLEQQPHMKEIVDAKSITIHSSFDTKLRVNYNRFPRLSARKHLVTVGRLSRVKRIDFIIQVLASLVQEEIDVDLLICGDGEEKAALTALASHSGVEERVCFLGLTDREITATALDVSEVFLFASQNEAMSLVVLESLYMGTPVVSTNTGDVPDAVLDGVTGFIVDSYDLKLYAAKIKELLKNGKSCYSSACQKMALNYTPDKMASEINRVFYGDECEGN